MRISARVDNRAGAHKVTVQTNDAAQTLAIPPRASGRGSSANGGELLFLALATCYCNDVYREAVKRGIVVEHVEVTVHGEFSAEGAPGTNITYQARVTAQAPEDAIRALLEHTDQVAEIQNTLRAATPITLDRIEAVPVPPAGASPRDRSPHSTRNLSPPARH